MAVCVVCESDCDVRTISREGVCLRCVADLNTLEIDPRRAPGAYFRYHPRPEARKPPIKSSDGKRQATAGSSSIRVSDEDVHDSAIRPARSRQIIHTPIRMADACVRKVHRALIDQPGAVSIETTEFVKKAVTLVCPLCGVYQESEKYLVLLSGEGAGFERHEAGVTIICGEATNHPRQGRCPRCGRNDLGVHIIFDLPRSPRPSMAEIVEDYSRLYDWAAISFCDAFERVNGPTRQPVADDMVNFALGITAAVIGQKYALTEKELLQVFSASTERFKPRAASPVGGSL